MQVLGTTGRIDIEIPYNIPPDRPSRIFVDDGSQLAGASARVEEFATADQYGIQADAFCRAVLDNAEPPVPLENALANMAVIEAVFRSGSTGRWEEPDSGR
jgi:predicted dehydrogenase